MPTLLMPFINESEDFVLGFECGQIWERLNGGDSFDNQIVHNKNRQQLQDMCNFFCLPHHFTDIDETYANLTVKPMNIKS